MSNIGVLFYFDFMIVTIGGFFIYTFIKKNTLLDIEKKNNAVYTDKNCGGNIYLGFPTNISGPFLRISVYNRFVVISTYKKIILNFEDIDKIKSKQTFISDEVVIHYKKNGFPFHASIWCKNAERHDLLVKHLDQAIEKWKNELP
jgi:hypothetical protein